MFTILAQELKKAKNVEQLQPFVIDMLMTTYVDTSVEKLQQTQKCTKIEGLLFTKNIINKLIDNLIDREEKQA